MNFVIFVGLVGLMYGTFKIMISQHQKSLTVPTKYGEHVARFGAALVLFLVLIMLGIFSLNFFIEKVLKL